MDIDEVHKHLLEISSSENIEEYLRCHKLWLFDVIYTFENLEQVSLYTVVPVLSESNCCDRYTDDLLLKNLLDLLEQNELKQLVKISTCKLMSNGIPKFLEIRNGKYYFNENDNDSKYNLNFKNKFKFD
jgi:hypothetical protein